MSYIILLFIIFIVIAVIFKSFIAPIIIFLAISIGIAAYRYYIRKKEQEARAMEEIRQKRLEAEKQQKQAEEEAERKRKLEAAAAAKKQKDAEIAEKFNNLLASIPVHEVSVKKDAVRKKRNECKKSAPDMSNVTKTSNLSKLSDYVAIDAETTGLHCSNEQIVELTAIRFREWEPVEIWSTLINPNKPIPEDAYKIHGIDDDMVENFPKIEAVIQDFDSFIGDDILVGHNLPFDLNFLDYAGSEYSKVKRKYYDTCKLAALLDIYTSDNKLTTLCTYFMIRDNSSAHRSASDALACGLLFKKLVDLKTQ